MPKLAVHLAIDGPIDDVVARARRAEEAGADAVYVIEGLRDPFVPLAAIAAATSRVTIGTFVANAYAAHTASRGDGCAGDRRAVRRTVMFGIGAGNRHINEWLFGLDMDRPLAKMRDYLAVLRAMLKARTATDVSSAVRSTTRRRASSGHRPGGSRSSSPPPARR